jgi:chromosome segregation ATPase
MGETVVSERARLRRLEAEAEEVRRARAALLDGEQAHARATALAEEVEAAREEIAALRERLERVSADEAALRERVDRAAAAMEAVQRSPSWRVTAPLRALKRGLRRR